MLRPCGFEDLGPFNLAWLQNVMMIAESPGTDLEPFNLAYI